MKSESRFWRSLKAKIPGHVMRVENGSMPGTPDVNICQSGREFWVELKDVDSYPKQATTPVFRNQGLRPEQVLWITQRTRQGGEVYIIGKVGKDIFCIPGKHAATFNQLTQSELVNLTLNYQEVLRFNEH